jgi:hypothetical protein
VTVARPAVGFVSMIDEHERSAFRRQAAALAAHEIDDDGTEEVRTEIIAAADRWRTDHGIEPLQTEGELHRRARALRLLG